MNSSNLQNRPSPCVGCALSPGAAANSEPWNHIQAQVCVLGAMPFWCHEGMDWRDPLNHMPQTRDAFRAKMFKPCRGWQREVLKLKTAGYYRHNLSAKKAYATLLTMHLGSLPTEPKESKKELIEDIRLLWKHLIKERNKALSGQLQ